MLRGAHPLSSGLRASPPYGGCRKRAPAPTVLATLSHKSTATNRNGFFKSPNDVPPWDFHTATARWLFPGPSGPSFSTAPMQGDALLSGGLDMPRSRPRLARQRPPLHQLPPLRRQLTAMSSARPTRLYTHRINRSSWPAVTSPDAVLSAAGLMAHGGPPAPSRPHGEPAPRGHAVPGKRCRQRSTSSASSRVARSAGTSIPTSSSSTLAIERMAAPPQAQ